MNEETKKKKKLISKHNMLSNTWFMIKLAWSAKEKKVPLMCLLSAVLAVSLNLVNLYVSPTILAILERHGSVKELLMTILVFAAGIMILSAGSRYVEINSLFGRITIRSYIINLVNQKAATTSYPNIDDKAFRALLGKSLECTCSNDRASEAIWLTLSTLLTNILGFVIYVSLIGTVQPVLIVLILVTTGISYIVTHYVSGYEYRHREEEAEYGSHIQYMLNESTTVATAKDIRIFGLRPWIEALYQKAFDAYTAFHAKAEGIVFWGKLTDLVMTFLRNAVVYGYLIHMVLENGLSVAEFLLYFTAVSGFASWVNGILENVSTLHRQSLELSVIRECLEYPEPFLFEGGEMLVPQKEMVYEIRLEHVSFRYPGALKDTLTDINLTLRAGENLAIVGLNGAGKTTLVKLICGFLDPTKGRVLLNGKDIRTYNRRDYYTMFSAVFQDFFLLAATVAANVAQSETDIDMERVKECVEKAGLRSVVEGRLGGYEAYMNREVYENAVQFSGGETQRLMLARALYKDAPFIILDEPTAALDPIAEADMYQKYHEMTNGKSSVYISHRLASTRFCDRIILLDDAGICEEGTHDELLALGGKYTELYEVQSKYYKEGAEEDERV